MTTEKRSDKMAHVQKISLVPIGNRFDRFELLRFRRPQAAMPSWHSLLEVSEAA